VKSNDKNVHSLFTYSLVVINLLDCTDTVPFRSRANSLSALKVPLGPWNFHCSERIDAGERKCYDSC